MISSLDESIAALLQTNDDYYGNWLNAHEKNSSFPPRKPRFLYIPKKKEMKLSPFHALVRSIKRKCYPDICYYSNKLLKEGMGEEEIIKAASVCAASVCAATYNDYTFMQRLINDPVLKKLALSTTSTLEETNNYIKSQLSSEELHNFIGDTLSKETFEKIKREIKGVAPL